MRGRQADPAAASGGAALAHADRYRAAWASAWHAATPLAADAQSSRASVAAVAALRAFSAAGKTSTAQYRGGLTVDEFAAGMSFWDREVSAAHREELLTAGFTVVKYVAERARIQPYLDKVDSLCAVAANKVQGRFTHPAPAMGGGGIDFCMELLFRKLLPRDTVVPLLARVPAGAKRARVPVAHLSTRDSRPLELHAEAMKAVATEDSQGAHVDRMTPAKGFVAVFSTTPTNNSTLLYRGSHSGPIWAARVQASAGALLEAEGVSLQPGDLLIFDIALAHFGGLVAATRNACFAQRRSPGERK